MLAIFNYENNALKVSTNQDSQRLSDMHMLKHFGAEAPLLKTITCSSASDRYVYKMNGITPQTQKNKSFQFEPYNLSLDDLFLRAHAARHWRNRQRRVIKQ